MNQMTWDRVPIEFPYKSFLLVSQNQYGTLIIEVFCFGSFDYKSIALPAELQGHCLIIKFFSLITSYSQQLFFFRA